MRLLFNMIKTSLLFGQYVSGSLLEKVSLQLISMMKEESFHHMDKILSLGEISDKLYFVTKGKVAVFINQNSRDYYQNYVDDCASATSEENSTEEKLVFLCYLNPGSNFNHISAIFSH